MTVKQLRPDKHFKWVQCSKPSNSQAYLVRHTNHDDEEKTFENADIDSDDEVIELPAPKPDMKIELVSLVSPKNGDEKPTETQLEVKIEVKREVLDSGESSLPQGWKVRPDKHKMQDPLNDTGQIEL